MKARQGVAAHLCSTAARIVPFPLLKSPCRPQASACCDDIPAPRHGLVLVRLRRGGWKCPCWLIRPIGWTDAHWTRRTVGSCASSCCWCFQRIRSRRPRMLSMLAWVAPSRSLSTLPTTFAAHCPVLCCHQPRATTSDNSDGRRPTLPLRFHLRDPLRTCNASLGSFDGGHGIHSSLFHRCSPLRHTDT